MSLLRSENGCPWDKEQTHDSIRKNFIEETYEAVEAIDQNDPEMLREELGDVLLQVVFHTQMEKEKGNFDFDDVCNEICQKLIVRHPHIFGDEQIGEAKDVANRGDEIKKETKGQKTGSETLRA
ncbi:MAG: MazG family protein, partial [Oscillospiraceae bacterium]|nr:MazG family protein [Oscillospiraceae bacterium]